MRGHGIFNGGTVGAKRPELRGQGPIYTGWSIPSPKCAQKAQIRARTSSVIWPKHGLNIPVSSLAATSVDKSPLVRTPLCQDDSVSRFMHRAGISSTSDSALESQNLGPARSAQTGIYRTLVGPTFWPTICQNGFKELCTEFLGSQMTKRPAAH